MKDLMIATLDPQLLQNINLKIYDGGEAPQNLFFTNEFAYNSKNIVETKTDVISFGERTWTLVFENLKQNNFNSLLANMILISGFLMSVLLFFIFYFINKNILLMQEKIKTEKFSIIGELSARLSHDLRNPLNVIRLSIQLLELENKEKLDSAAKKRIESINRAVDRIAHQVDDVLGFVRIKPLSLESVSLMSILESALEDIKIPEKIKIIKPESDITVSVDPKQMETVFSNIIINAIQAIDESGKIEIRFVESSNHVQIQFIDSGPGIPPENLEKIFEPLFTTKQVGTGLGLSSCKTIIEKHGGTISVENNPTTFTVRLPKIIKS
jgi:signal transduction histidine kinase